MKKLLIILLLVSGAVAQRSTEIQQAGTRVALSANGTLRLNFVSGVTCVFNAATNAVDCTGGGGGFTAPAGWTATTGTGTGAANDFTNSVTETYTSGSGSLYKTTWTPTSSALGAGNLKGWDFSGTMTVTTSGGSTAAPTYSTWTINDVSGNLTHALADVQRLNCQSTAGQQIDECTTLYPTIGLVSLAGPLPLLTIIHATFDPLSTTVTIPEADSAKFSVASTVTGGGGITSSNGVIVQDVTGAGLAGTNRVGVGVGGITSGSNIYPLFVEASGTPTNMAYFGANAPVWDKGGIVVSADLGTLNGYSGADTHNKLGVVNNAANSFMYFYDGTGAFEMGISNASSSNFVIRRPGASSNELTVVRSSGLINMLNFGPVNLWESSTAPTISSGFGSSPSVATNNGTGAFTINVGTGGTATNGVIGLPTASNGWVCTGQDLTTQSTTVFLLKQIATSTSTATIANFNTAGAQAAWVASDILHISCFAR